MEMERMYNCEMCDCATDGKTYVEIIDERYKEFNNKYYFCQNCVDLWDYFVTYLLQKKKHKKIWDKIFEEQINLDQYPKA